MGKIFSYILENRDKSQRISFLSVLLFCLYFVTVPRLDILPWFGSYNEKRIMELLLLLVVASTFISSSLLRKNWLAILEHLPPGSKRMLLFIAVMGLVSSAGAAFPRFSLLEVSLFCLLFGGTICVASCYVELGDLFIKMVAIALFLLGWFYLAVFVAYYLTALSGGITFAQLSNFSNFSNIRFFNQLQSWTLPLIVIPLLLFTRRPLFIRALFIVVAMGWWFLLFSSSCRGTLVGCLFAFSATFLVFGKKAQSWRRWQIIAIAGGFAAYLLFFSFIPSIMSIDVQTIMDRDLISSSRRLELWSVAGKMIQARPWLGYGPMQYAAEPGLMASHPHNSIAQIAAEWGLPVAFAVLTLFIWGLLRWLKIITSSSTLQGQNIYAALFASLLTAAVHSLLSGIIVMPLSQLMMVLVIGWMLGISARQSIARQNYHRLKHVILWISFPVVISGLVWSLFPGVLHLTELQTEFHNSHPEETILKPRFWLQGQLVGHKPEKKEYRGIVGTESNNNG